MAGIDKLSTSSSLKDLIDRQELLTDAIEAQKNNLKSILESKNVEVAEEEDKMSILIDKVNMFDDYESPILWLYKDGVEFDNEFVEGYSKDGVSQSKESDHLYLQAAKGNYATKSYVCTKKIDIGNYSKIYVEWDNIGTSAWPTNSHLQIVDEKGSSDAISELVVNLPFSKKISEFDISNMGGWHYIRALACYNGEFPANLTGSVLRVYKLWLEK